MEWSPRLRSARRTCQVARLFPSHCPRPSPPAPPACCSIFQSAHSAFLQRLHEVRHSSLPLRSACRGSERVPPSMACLAYCTQRFDSGQNCRRPSPAVLSGITFQGPPTLALLPCLFSCSAGQGRGAIRGAPHLDVQRCGGQAGAAAGHGPLARPARVLCRPLLRYCGTGLARGEDSVCWVASFCSCCEGSVLCSSRIVPFVRSLDFAGENGPAAPV